MRSDPLWHLETYDTIGLDSVSEEALGLLTNEMGFPRNKSATALLAYNNNLEQAVQFLDECGEHLDESVDYRFSLACEGSLEEHITQLSGSGVYFGALSMEMGHVARVTNCVIAIYTMTENGDFQQLAVWHPKYSEEQREVKAISLLFYAADERWPAAPAHFDWLRVNGNSTTVVQWGGAQDTPGELTAPSLREAVIKVQFARTRCPPLLNNAQHNSAIVIVTFCKRGLTQPFSRAD
jgi:hypothetical protein